MQTPHITDREFEEKVLKSKKPVLVDFFAPWCGPCRTMAPVIDEINEETSDKYDIYKINVDENNETAGKYYVMSIPTIIIFKNGEAKNTMVGVQQKKYLLEQLKKLEE